ncbi:MAG TPA: Ku protein [Candidatus Limnocylindria bacterium]
MARAMWRGAIQFGLVTIPVKLYLATESTGIGFNMLHASCLNRIQMKIYCPHHDEVVPRSETVRGYEWSKGRYVVVTDDDLEAVPLKTIRAIEIAMFVDAQKEEHGAQFVKSAYYLEPDPVGKKAFFLLREVLADTGKSAICKVVMKDREQLAAINPYADTMLLTTLHWPDEIRSVEELAVDRSGIEIKASERKMAEQLIASMTGEFKAEEFQDDYRQALMGVIESKVAGEEPTPMAKAEPTRIGDLMAALEASVSAAREARRDAATGASADERKAAAEKAPPKTAARKTGDTKSSRAKKAAEADETQTRRRKTA